METSPEWLQVQLHDLQAQVVVLACAVRALVAAQANPGTTAGAIEREIQETTASMLATALPDAMVTQIDAHKSSVMPASSRPSAAPDAPHTAPGFGRAD